MSGVTVEDILSTYLSDMRNPAVMEHLSIPLMPLICVRDDVMYWVPPCSVSHCSKVFYAKHKFGPREYDLCKPHSVTCLQFGYSRAVAHVQRLRIQHIVESRPVRLPDRVWAFDGCCGCELEGYFSYELTCCDKTMYVCDECMLYGNIPVQVHMLLVLMQYVPEDVGFIIIMMLRQLVDPQLIRKNRWHH